MAKVLALLLVGVLLTALAALIPAALWYCFDDTLARLVKYPALGRVPFGPVLAFTWFVTALFKGTATATAAKD